MWFLTVWSEMNSSSVIRLLSLPSRSRRTISASRAVTPSFSAQRAKASPLLTRSAASGGVRRKSDPSDLIPVSPRLRRQGGDRNDRDHDSPCPEGCQNAGEPIIPTLKYAGGGANVAEMKKA